MKTLVVYYSRTGTTRHFAERIAAALDADLEEIRDRARRTGLLGWLRCGAEGWKGTLADIAPATRHPGDYDLVVVGGPIWSASMSSPVRSYLRRHRAELPRVAFFCTCGGHGMEQVFAQMKEECGKPPAATVFVREAELAKAPAAAVRFAAALGAPPIATPRPDVHAPAPA